MIYSRRGLLEMSLLSLEHDLKEISGSDASRESKLKTEINKIKTELESMDQKLRDGKITSDLLF